MLRHAVRSVPMHIGRDLLEDINPTQRLVFCRFCAALWFVWTKTKFTYVPFSSGLNEKRNE